MQEYIGHGNWSKVSIDRRCQIIASAAPAIAMSGETWTRLCQSPQRVDPVETITGELFPLCSALKFIGRQGPRLLRKRRLGWRGRPAWLWGVRSEVRRDPHGKVLVLGTWNYPLFLVGVQVAQALAAGNDVWLKPAEGCEAISAQLAGVFHACGVPEDSLRVLDASTDAAIKAIDAGVDLVVLTGAAATGRAVLRRTAETLTPTIMELSGCDAVIVLPDADLDQVAKAISFGLTFNSGATCIGPRRLIVGAAHAEALLDRIDAQLQSRSDVAVHPAARLSAARLIDRALAEGSVDRRGRFDGDRLQTAGRMAPLVLDHVKPDQEIASADLFVPALTVIRVDDVDDAVRVVNDCPYRLAASIFGPRREAEIIASRLRVGSVAVNDLIVPTADPRVPFGGRGNSGFGVTRGGEGLLAMTVPVVTGVRRGRTMPHLMPRQPSDAQTLLGALQLLHASSLSGRWSGFKRVLAARRSPDAKNESPDDPI